MPFAAAQILKQIAEVGFKSLPRVRLPATDVISPLAMVTKRFAFSTVLSTLPKPNLPVEHEWLFWA
jgi:hypothetical protein